MIINLKRILFIILIINFLSCSKTASNFIEPKIVFLKENIIIENQSNFDYYNIEVRFANKYDLAYLTQAKKSTIKFKYGDIKPSAQFRELSKNKYVINFQDSLGNNYQVVRKKIIYTNYEHDNSNSFFSTLNKVISSSAGITVLLGLLAAFVALHQVKSNVISSSRIKWIEEFKNNISQHNNAICQMIFYYSMFLKHRGKDESPKIESDKYYDEYVKFHYLANIHEANLFINLNPEEKMYQDIQATLKGIRKAVNDMDEDSDTDVVYKAVSRQLQSLRSQSQKALKVEWRKSKKMFYIKWFN
ncbi:hypothetical protein AR687_10610 [Flavobacteriaceae bacterium CRH]|nr:hypothetical protein AR687_10610 [Flavobacteriaceae bacterium CRH]